MSKTFEVGDFAMIKGNKGQLKHDTVVYIAGTTLVPLEDDPYKRQVYFVVGEITNDGGYYKLETAKSYYILPTSLKSCAKLKEEEISKALDEQFKAIEEELG